MRLLLLGGTQFVGRTIAEQALAGGDEVTLFHRGQTNPELFPDSEHVLGDRDGGLGALGTGKWDAVIDTCGYYPRLVRDSARLLRDRVGRYVFVSSVSVYADVSDGANEESPVGTVDDETTEDLGAEHERYGPLKALCEREVEQVFGDRALVVRPGLIVGPHDPTGRFTYWPHRLARGGEILAPGPPDRRVQFIDVRDLAGWILHMVDVGSGGVFNATGTGVTWSDLLGGGAVTWVSDAFLVGHGVGEWMELPLWIADPAWTGMHRIDVSRAITAGLVFRPLRDTIQATLTGAETVDGVGLDPEREAELLAAA